MRPRSPLLFAVDKNNSFMIKFLITLAAKQGRQVIVIHAGVPLQLDTLKQELSDEQLRNISIMKVRSSTQLKQN